MKYQNYDICRIHFVIVHPKQLLKKEDIVSTGGEAKMIIQEGLVSVNGVVETRRGRKLYSGDVVEANGKKIVVK